MGSRTGKNKEIFNEYKYLTYEQAFEKAENFGTAIEKYIKFDKNKQDYKFILFYANNCV